MQLGADERRWLRESPDALTVSPVVFALRCGINPDPWQRKVLSSRSKDIILNCHRQSGKSIISGIKAGFGANAEPGSLTLCVSSDRQVKELFYKIKTFLRIAGIRENKTDNADTIILQNDSRIVVVPNNPKSIRGFSAHRVLVEEAAFLHDDIYAAFRPMVAQTKGSTTMISTPNGRRGFFSDAWHQGGESWERHTMRADHNPRIDKAWLENERRVMGEQRFRQEFLCEFLESNDAVFSYDAVRAAIDPSLEPLLL